MTRDAQAACQAGFDVRFDWGLAGVEALAADSAAIVIVDVLSFSTCVDVAVAAGAEVYPYRFRDPSARSYAESIGAVCAGRRGDPDQPYSLSPASLAGLPQGSRLVLPSPNGATLSLATGDVPTFAACLRNSGAVAAALSEISAPVSVIAAGERWPDGSLRPALEDLAGAAAVIAGLPGTLSPEARLARAAFSALVSEDAGELLADCVSGRELAAAGYSEDVVCAAQLDVSKAVPRMVEGAYRSD